jgi:transcriptional regulator with XRE-family HTH domain
VGGDENLNAVEPGSAAERLVSEIKRLRGEAGLSQADLADRVGYTRQYVSRAEISRRNLPSLDLIETLDAALGAGGRLLELREKALAERHGRRITHRDERRGQLLRRTASPDTAGNVVKDSLASATTVRSMVRSSAQDARRINTWMETTSTGSHVIQMYRDCLMASSVDFLHRPAAEVFNDLDELRRELFSDIGAHRYHPRYDREFLALVGMTSVVLAHASHLLGHPNEGMTQARLALQCADEAGHVELGAWACGTQALIAEGRGNLQEAIGHIRNARQQLDRSRTPGSAAVRLASYEARIAARQSADTDIVQDALIAAEQAQEALRGKTDVADLDDIGGILEFPAAKAAMYAGQVYTLIGRPKLAEQHAQMAIDNYLSGAPEQRSYGDIALARIDIAAARLTSRDLDGVRDALVPVFTLPAALRTEHLRPPLTALATTLTSEPCRTAVGVTELREKITAFTVAPRLPMERT